MSNTQGIRKRFSRFVSGCLPQMIILTLILLFIIVYLAPNIFISIQSGEKGVLWKRFGGGTVVETTYDEGLHLIWPWNKMYIYNIRIQQNTFELKYVTNEGLPIGVQISTRYYPQRELVGVLHKFVGPEYFEAVVVPEVRSVLFESFSKLTLESIYSGEAMALMNQALSEAVEQVAQRFIIVDDVNILRIDLPEEVAKAMEYKLQQKQYAEAQLHIILKEQRVAEMRRIEAQGYSDANNILSASLTGNILQWKGIEATMELSKSPNAKMVVIGRGENGLPLILDARQ